MTIHDLKCWPADFAAIEAGTRTHEARRDDRGFAVGDTLRLREWTPDDPEACHWTPNDPAGATPLGLPGKFTGRTIDRLVTHLTKGQYGLPADLAIMSIPSPATRRRLPTKRARVGYALRINKVRLHVTIGLYPDGTPGEVFLDMSKEGSALRHFANAFAIATSRLLQHGVSVADIAHAFENLSGGPSGAVEGHENIKEARSIVDLVAQLLRAEHGL